MECTQVIPNLDLTLDQSQAVDEHVGRLLIPKTDQSEAAEYFLKHGQNIVGRCSVASDVCIQDVSVSRKHAIIVCSGNKCFQIYDTGSANGTYLESRGSKCKMVPHVRYNLCSGDKLTFGTIVTTFTKELESPLVIDDSDSDTGSESMLPLDVDDDLEDIISGPANRNKKRLAIVSDTEEDEPSTTSRDSSPEIQSSQIATTADKDVSPFKTPIAPPIRSSQFRSSLSPQSGNTPKKSFSSPEESKFTPTVSSTQECPVKSKKNIYDVETQLNVGNYDSETQMPSPNDSIYERETQGLNTSVFDAETQKLPSDKWKKSPLSSSRNSEKGSKTEKVDCEPRKLSDLYNLETQKADSSIFSKETQNPEGDLYSTETQKVNEDIFTKATQKAPSDLFSAETQKVPEDVYSKETQRVPSNLSSKETQGGNEDIYSKETQKVPSDLFGKETQKIPADLFSIETQKLPVDLFGKETQKVSIDLYDKETQKVPLDLFGKETQKVPADLFSKETQKAPADLFSKETQKVPVDLFSKETQKVPDLFGKETQRVTDDIFGKETQKVSENIFDKETQLLNTSLFNQEKQRKEQDDENILTAETQLVSGLSSGGKSVARDEPKKDPEESIFDMATQKLPVSERPNRTEIEDKNEEDDDMTQIISSTPAVSSKIGKRSLAAIRALEDDHLGSPIGSDPVNLPKKLIRSKWSNSPNSNNQSSNTSSLYSMELDSPNGPDVTNFEDPDNNLHSRAAVTGEKSRSEAKSSAGKHEEQNDLNDMLTQKIPVLSNKKSFVCKREPVSSLTEKCESDSDLSKQVGSLKHDLSVKQTSSVKKALNSTSDLLEMSTQLIDSFDGTAQNSRKANSVGVNKLSTIRDRQENYEKEELCSMATQKLPGEKLSLSKRSNYNNSEMDLDDMLTQKIDTVDGTDNITKVKKFFLKRPSSTPKVSAKSTAKVSVSALDEMLTQKLPCGEQSENLTSHSVLSMDVCQSQPLEAALHSASKASSSILTSGKKSRKNITSRSNLDIISSGDETDDDISNFVKPLTDEKVEKHSPVDQEVEALCKKIEERAQKSSKFSIIKERPESPASQSVIVEEDISESQSSYSDPVLPEETVSFFRRIPDAKTSISKSEDGPIGLAVEKSTSVLKEDGETKSSGTVTPDDLAFDGENADTKMVTEVLVPSLKLSGTITPDDLELDSDPANKQVGKVSAESETKVEVNPDFEDNAAGHAETSAQPVEGKTEVKKTGLKRTFKVEEDASSKSHEDLESDEIPASEQKTLSKRTSQVKEASSKSNEDSESKETPASEQKTLSKRTSKVTEAPSKSQEDLESKETPAPEQKTLSKRTSKVKEASRKSSEDPESKETPASEEKTLSKRTSRVKEASSESSENPESKDTPTPEQDDLPPVRTRRSRVENTAGKYKSMLKGIKTTEKEESSTSRKSRSTAKSAEVEVEKESEKSKAPTASTRGRTSLRDEPKTLSRTGKTSVSNSQTKSASEDVSESSTVARPSSVRSSRKNALSERLNSESSGDELVSRKSKAGGQKSKDATLSPPKSSTSKEEEAKVDSSDVASKRESVRSRGGKSLAADKGEVKESSVKVSNRKQSVLKKAHDETDSEEDVPRSESSRASRSSRAAAFTRKNKPDSQTVSPSSTLKAKVKPKVPGTESHTDSEEESKTRSPSKRKASRSVKEPEVKKPAAKVKESQSPIKEAHEDLEGDTSTRTPSKRKASQIAKEPETKKGQPATKGKEPKVPKKESSENVQNDTITGAQSRRKASQTTKETESKKEQAVAKEPATPKKDVQELKTRTPSKRKAAVKESDSKKDSASDAPTPKKKLKLNDESDFKAPTSDTESGPRSSRRKTSVTESQEEVKEPSEGRKSTRRGKQVSPVKPPARSDSQSSLNEDHGRRRRKVTETSSDDDSKTPASPPKKETGAARRTNAGNVTLPGRRLKVKEVTRLSTRSASLSDSDSVQSGKEPVESTKKPVERKGRAGGKKSFSVDTSASENEDASSTHSRSSTPAKTRVSKVVKQEGSPLTTSPRSSTRRVSAPIEKYHIMFTGLDDKTLAKFENIVAQLGGVVEENPSACTVLVTDKVRRTIKFLSTLAQGKPIVSIKWLEVSNKMKTFKDPFEYLIQDKQSEQNFDFKLSESLTKALDAPLLDGYSVFVTPSVKPEPSQMKAIIESAKGKFLAKQPTVWDENSFIVSTPEDKSHWPKGKGSKTSSPSIVSAEVILRGVLQQKLDLQAYALK